MPPNGSVLGLTLTEDGLPESLKFNWLFPYIEEDIWVISCGKICEPFH